MVSDAAKRGLAVAIDGPAGAGKSTVAKRVARALGYIHVDTGAMYRAAALSCLRAGLDLGDHAAVGRQVANLKIDLQHSESGVRVFLDGEDVTAAIREKQVGEAVSLVAQVREVREQLVRLQRQMGARGGVVMDGRDIGTVVLPAAEVKVFLTASPAERARRRFEEMRAAGAEARFEEVLESIRTRDEIDQSREISPLKKADDAVVIDTTGLSADEVVARILELCREKEGGPPCST